MRDLQFRNRLMGQGFAPMPKVVLKSPMLSMQSKTVYAQLMDYGWYGEAFPGRERLAEENGCHPNTIDKAIKELKDIGLISVVRRGNMKTNLYIIEDIMAVEMINILRPVGSGFSFDPVPEGEEEPPQEPQPKQQIPYERIIKYLNEQAGTQFKHDSKETRRLIKARFNAGFDTKDFKKVIDFKVKEWKTDPEMMQYLRPITLFSNKFESYLNAAISASAPTPPQGTRTSTPNVQREDFLTQYGFRRDE